MDWETAARRIGDEVDLSRFPERVLERIFAAEPLYVACSGGADSVFALLCVFGILERRDGLGRLRVLHFNHELRGLESDADAAFVSEVCESLGLHFLSSKASWDVDLDRVNESVARDARLAFFRSATDANLENPQSIVTGHHAGDVAESILMRLSRGAGLAGLCAPRSESSAGGGLSFLRPFLGFSREEIRDSLKAVGTHWREDATNESGKNYRARLRSEVLPAWRKTADRELEPGILRSRSLLEEDANALEKWASDIFEKAWSERDSSLDRKAVESLPRAVQRRLLNRFAEVAEASPKIVDAALHALVEGEAGEFSLGVGCHLVVGEVSLRVERSEKDRAATWREFRLPVGCVAYLPDGARLDFSRFSCEKLAKLNVDLTANDDSRSAWLSESGNFLGGVEVRRRQAGDAFKPLGKSSEKKLKTLLIERKIPRRTRDVLPVFVLPREGIVWMPGLPPSVGRKLGSATETALRLTYDR